jgi:cobalt-zinc-cadmium efflux system membrane fusion protein
VAIGHDIPDVTGEIAWLGPLVSEATRTAKARVILSNPDGLLRPGLFVTARVAVASEPVAVRVPKTALQTMDDQVVVFIQDADGFEPQPVQTGRESAEYVEITAGLSQGQSYVSKGAFTLKAQLGKGAFGDGHNH